MISILDLYEAATDPSTRFSGPARSVLAAWIYARAFNGIVHGTATARLFKKIARLQGLLAADGLGSGTGIDLCAPENVDRVHAILEKWIHPVQPAGVPVESELQIGSHHSGGRGTSIIV